MVKEVKIGQSAAKLRMGERSTTIPQGSTGRNPGKREELQKGFTIFALWENIELEKKVS